MDFNIEKINNLLLGEKWNWAKTYISVPHEYIVRGKCNMSDEEFLYIVDAQRKIGIPERWGKYNFPYLYVDGYKYWTMGDTYENTIILNRQKVFGEFDSLSFISEYYSNEDSVAVAKHIVSVFNKPVFECGFGYGNFVQHSGLPSSEYHGVDPSKKAVEHFRTINKGWYQRVSNKSFEESVERWRGKNCVVIALFGSASYIMWPYLKILADDNKSYFLMFYKDGFVPEGLERMHHFRYTEQWLKKVFPKAEIKEWNDYIIVSTEEINIKPVYVQKELF